MKTQFLSWFSNVMKIANTWWAMFCTTYLKFSISAKKKKNKQIWRINHEHKIMGFNSKNKYELFGDAITLKNIPLDDFQHHLFIYWVKVKMLPSVAAFMT